MLSMAVGEVTSQLRKVDGALRLLVVVISRERGDGAARRKEGEDGGEECNVIVSAAKLVGCFPRCGLAVSASQTLSAL